PVELRKLQIGLERFAKGEQNQLLRALAAAFDALGEAATAEPLWTQLAQRQPNDLGVRLRLFERVLLPGHEAQSERLLADIKRIDGVDGPATAFAEAACLVVQKRGNDAKRLAAARTLLARAAELRPSWAWVPLLEADSYEQ